MKDKDSQFIIEAYNQVQENTLGQNTSELNPYEKWRLAGDAAEQGKGPLASNGPQAPYTITGNNMTNNGIPIPVFQLPGVSSIEQEMGYKNPCAGYDAVVELIVTDVNGEEFNYDACVDLEVDHKYDKNVGEKPAVEVIVGPIYDQSNDNMMDSNDNMMEVEPISVEIKKYLEATLNGVSAHDIGHPDFPEEES